VIVNVNGCTVWMGSGRGAQDANNVWCPVSYGNYNGWANAFYLLQDDRQRVACAMYADANGCTTPAAGGQPATKIVRVRVTQDLNLRAGPDPHSDKVLGGPPPDAFMPKDTMGEVRYTDPHADCRRHDVPGAVHTIWCPVSYRDHSGWANAFYLEAENGRLSCSIDGTSFGCDQAAVTSHSQPPSRGIQARQPDGLR
jgi:uncharacterized protein YraI